MCRDVEAYHVVENSYADERANHNYQVAQRQEKEGIWLTMSANDDEAYEGKKTLREENKEDG